jgi:hypothetical protein
MRVGPFDLGDNTVQSNGFFSIKLGSERVVGYGSVCRCKAEGRCQHGGD